MANFPNPEELFVPKEVNPNFSQAEANPMMKEWELATMQLVGGKPPALLAIENDALAPTQSAHIVDTEGGAEADEVRIISTAGVHDGCILELYAADNGRAVTVKHNPNQLNGITLSGGADKPLSTTFALRLQREGDYWKERPLGGMLSDALDGERRADAGVGASEWALAQVHAKAEQNQLPLFTPLWSHFSSQDGYLRIDIDNGVLTEAAFPQAYARLVRASGTGDAAVVDFAVYQAELAVNGGTVNRFGLDTAARTFRLPIWKNAAIAAPDASKSITPGMFLMDQFQGHWHVSPNTNASVAGGSAAATSRRSVTSTQEDTMNYWSAGRPVSDGVNGDPRVSDETRGKRVVLYPLLKMYGAVTEAGEVDLAALVQTLTGKLDVTRYEAEQVLYKNACVLAWGSVTAAGELTDGYNVSSISRSTTGQYLVTFAKALANTNYAVGGTTARSGTNGFLSVNTENKKITSCRIDVLYYNGYANYDFNFAIIGRGV